MAYTERDLHPYVKRIVEEEGSINTTDLNTKLRDMLILSEDDLEITPGRNDDRFSQIVRNLVRYTADDNGMLVRKGYIVDKNVKPAVFYAIEQDHEIGAIVAIDERQIRARRTRKRSYNARKVDFERKYEQNRTIGDAGERFALDFERDRLRDLENLPFNVLDEVVHISHQDGDGAGYDILSKKDEFGEPLYIEVKTTQGDLNTPFFISINELTFMEEFQEFSVIYRVYNYNPDTNTAEVEVITYNQLMADFYIDAVTYKVIPRFIY